MFGSVGLIVAHAARPFMREERSILATAPPFVAAYALTAAVDRPRLVAALLWATGIPRVRNDLPFALLLAATGPAVEVAVARTGAFSYTRSHGEVLPWLAGLYIHGAPLALAVAGTADTSPRR